MALAPRLLLHRLPPATSHLRAMTAEPNLPNSSAGAGCSFLRGGERETALTCAVTFPVASLGQARHEEEHRCPADLAGAHQLSDPLHACREEWFDVPGHRHDTVPRNPVYSPDEEHLRAGVDGRR